MLKVVRARLLTNGSNNLGNVHTNGRENITRTHAKRKAGYFFVARSVVGYAFASGKLNGGLDFPGTVKIRGFDIFRDVNQEGADTVLVTVAH